LKLPPGRFSITSGWPIRLRRSSPSARMNTSWVPPALAGITTRIGRAG
jgi:hypothetical protein